MNKVHIHSRFRGTTIIELLIYIAILVIMIFVVFSGIVQMSREYGRVRFDRRVTSTAQTALERIVREIKLAKTINVVDADTIDLVTYQKFNPDIQIDIPITTRTLTRTGSIITLDSIPITESSVSVTSLIFTKLDNSYSIAGSRAVRVEMQVEAGTGDYKTSRKYYALAILRNSYSN